MQGSGAAPANVLDFAKGRVRSATALQVSRLVRHSQSKYHELSCKQLLGEAAGVSNTAPNIADFRRVLGHISVHGAAAGVELRWGALRRS